MEPFEPNKTLIIIGAIAVGAVIAFNIVKSIIRYANRRKSQ